MLKCVRIGVGPADSLGSPWAKQRRLLGATAVPAVEAALRAAGLRDSRASLSDMPFGINWPTRRWAWHSRAADLPLFLRVALPFVYG